MHKGHGRIEIRHCRAIGDLAILAYVDPQGQWPARQSLIEVESVCRQGAQSTIQTRHFISRGPPEAQGRLATLRGHWGIENSVHWVLDRVFREDESRIRKGHAAFHMSLLRRRAHNLLRRVSLSILANPEGTSHESTRLLL